MIGDGRCKLHAHEEGRAGGPARWGKEVRRSCRIKLIKLRWLVYFAGGVADPEIGDAGERMGSRRVSVCEEGLPEHRRVSHSLFHPSLAGMLHPASHQPTNPQTTSASQPAQKPIPPFCLSPLLVVYPGRYLTCTWHPLSTNDDARTREFNKYLTLGWCSLGIGFMYVAFLGISCIRLRGKCVVLAVCWH